MLYSRVTHACVQRSGSVAPLVAVLMVPLMGILAIALDGSLLMATRRKAQSAANASALAGAVDLFNNYPQNHGYDTGGTAKKSALTTAKANGFNNDGQTNTVTVNVNANANSTVKYSQGQFAGKALPQNYIEVVISVNQEPFFSAIWGAGTLQVPGHAVARAKYSAASPGILVLDPHGNQSFDVTGNGMILTGSSSIVVDSDSSQAAKVTGNGDAEAANFYITGKNPGYAATGSGQFVGTVSTGVPSTPDPLATLPEPSAPALPTAGYTIHNGQQVPFTVTNQGVNYSGSDPLVLYAGLYNGLSVTGSGSLTMLPDPNTGYSTFYLQNQGFSATGQGSVTATGVMIYSDGSQDISITGQGSVTMTPPSSGTYAGMMLFMERSASKNVNITGNGSMDIQGTFYTAHAKTSITGNGGLNGQGNPLDTIGAQFITYDLSVTGNGSFNVDYQNGTPTTVRQIQLVE